MRVALRAPVVPSLAFPFLQRTERQLPRRLQIAIPVLVMNGQCLDGEISERHHRRVRRVRARAGRPRFAERDELAPDHGRLAEPAVAPASQAQPIEAFPSHLDRAAFRRAAITGGRALDEPRPLVDPADRERLWSVGTTVSAGLDEAHGASRDSGERDQIQPVVLEHRLERTRIAAAHELEEAGRDLESGTSPTRCTSNSVRSSVDRRQPPSVASSERVFHSRRAVCSVSKCGTPSSGIAMRWKSQRVSITGTSKVLPL